MSKEIPLNLIVDTVSNEKGVSQEVIFRALEAALVSATKKKHGADIAVRVDIDRKTGTYNTYRVWTVVEDPEPNVPLESPLTQITFSAAQYENPEIQLGDAVEEQIESVDFGRIDAQTAKQVIIQKVKEAERQLVYEEYLHKKYELVNGTCKKNTRDGAIIDLGGNAEGLLAKEEMLPKEAFRPGDRVRAVLKDVVAEQRGPQLILSRAGNEMLRALFMLEVPEVAEGIIEIKGIARDPGLRAKIAVKTNDSRMDPVGACVGMRGARVQAVSNELGGERVDIILWDESPAQYVMNAMAPADIVSIIVDDETQVMDVAVTEESLSQAIGRGGQNVKLASQLTGWTLNVISDKEAKQKDSAEAESTAKLFMESLTIDEDVAEVLVNEGFTSLEEIAYVPIQELLEIEGFDEDIVNELRSRAKDTLVTKAIADEEAVADKEPSEDLLSVEGMTKPLAFTLAKQDIITRDDLAELSVDDLMQVAEFSDPEEAARLIMAARAHWFADENS